MANLRMTAKSLMLRIVFGIVIVSFILNSVSTCLTGSKSGYVVKVNKQEIGREQFEHALARERNRMHQLGGEFSKLLENEDYVKYLRQETLSLLIDEELMNQYTKKLGLKISDEKVKNAIFSTEAFQVNGKFDNARYNDIINQMTISVSQYVQMLRDQLATRQLLNAIIDSDFMLEGENDDLVELVTQQRIVRKATIDIGTRAASQKVSDDEIKSYYDQHKTSFMEPEKVRVSYIKIGAEMMLESASNSEIRDYYETHQAEFTRPQRKRYSVIQTKTKGEANIALEQLKNGMDFSDIAKAQSTDIISAKFGGDIGWLDEASIPEELKNADLKEKGQVSGIIESSVGFLIARLDDIQGKKIYLLSEVQDAIAETVKQKKALDSYHCLQQKVRDAVKSNGNSLAGVEQAVGLKAVETGWFSHDKLPEELNSQVMSDIIFKSDLVGKNDRVSRNLDIVTPDSDHMFVIRVTAHRPEVVQPLYAVKDQIIALIKHYKAEQQAKVDAKKLLGELKEGKGEEALETTGMSFGPAKTLTRTEQDPISRAAFNLSLPSKNKPSYGTTLDMQGNVILLALDEVKGSKVSREQKKEIIRTIFHNNTQFTFEAIMTRLRKEAKIKFGDSII